MRSRLIILAGMAAIALLAIPASSNAATPEFTVKPATLIGGSSAHFEFSYPVALSYACSLDGATAATCSSPYDVSGLADGTHSLSVTASFMGTTEFCTPMPDPLPPMCIPTPEMKTSDPATTTFTVDTTIPGVAIANGPKNRFVSSSSQATFTLVSTEAGSFECSLDGKAITPCASPLKLSKLKAGVHRLVVLARDAAGNASTPLTRSFAVNSKRTTYKFVKGGKVKKCTKRKRGKKCATKKL